MSCISKILEIKENQDFIVCDDIAIEGGGTYKDYEYLITFVKFGHRCGYVAISKEHPLYDSYDKYNNEPCLSVHGGVTFFDSPRFEELTGRHKCDDKWIGFDAMHSGDSPCISTSEKYFPENEQTKRMRRHTDIYDLSYLGYEHRSYNYMETECKKLIEQLIELKNEN